VMFWTISLGIWAVRVVMLSDLWGGRAVRDPSLAGLMAR
jgi:hypothetical protein